MNCTKQPPKQYYPYSRHHHLLNTKPSFPWKESVLAYLPRFPPSFYFLTQNIDFSFSEWGFRAWKWRHFALRVFLRFATYNIWLCFWRKEPIHCIFVWAHNRFITLDSPSNIVCIPTQYNSQVLSFQTRISLVLYLAREGIWVSYLPSSLLMFLP